MATSSVSTGFNAITASNDEFMQEVIARIQRKGEDQTCAEVLQSLLTDDLSKARAATIRHVLHYTGDSESHYPAALSDAEKWQRYRTWLARCGQAMTSEQAKTRPKSRGFTSMFRRKTPTHDDEVDQKLSTELQQMQDRIGELVLVTGTGSGAAHEEDTAQPTASATTANEGPAGPAA